VTYRPNAVITVSNVDFTGDTVGEISMFRGRRTVYERANAGFASIEFIDEGEPIFTPGGTVEPYFEVGAPIVVSIDLPQWFWVNLADSWAGLGSSWADVGPSVVVSSPVLTHTMSDWTATPISRGDKQALVAYRVQGIGRLAQMNRTRIFAGGRGAELDGARVLAAVEDVFPTMDTSAVDSGVYLLAALDAEDGGYNALRTVQDAGFSAEGVLYETADGRIGYADANRRGTNAEIGYKDISLNSMAVGGVSFSQDLSNLTNRVVLEYDSGVVDQSDSSSINQFGLFETRLETVLADEDAANERARSFLLRHIAPQTVFETASFNLSGLEDDVLEAILSLDVNDAIRITNIPFSFGFVFFSGFVEGIGLRVDSVSAVLTLTVSDFRLSVAPVTWGKVRPDLAWVDVFPSNLQWRQVAVL
jgi:hypothetical protein